MSDTTETDAPGTPEQPDETTEPDQSDAPEADEQDDREDEPDWRSNFDADKAADRIRKLQSEAKNLRTRAKEAEEKAKGADEKDTRIAALEATNLQYEVGYDLGLPKELVSRLRGSTRDELIEDAKSLLELVKTPATRATRKPVEALRGGGEPEQEPEERDLDKIGSRMFRR